jgi:hypothetical protein
MSGREIAVEFLKREADRKGEQADQQAKEAFNSMEAEGILNPTHLDDEADKLMDCANQFGALPEDHPAVRNLDSNLEAVGGDEKLFLKWFARLVRKNTGISVWSDL